MIETSTTQVTPLQVRQRRAILSVATEDTSAADWQTVNNLPPRKSLLKNLAVASALVLCAVTLRTGALPSLDTATDAILTAATDHSLLDEQLGKLSFVSALFPEAVLVFGESHTPELTLPVSGGVVVHAWSESEPYMSFRSSTTQVHSSASGEVTGIYHGYGDERIVQISGNDGLSCLYGNLDDVAVQLGDAVSVGSLVGTLLPGEDLVLEVRQYGTSIAPASYFMQ